MTNPRTSRSRQSARQAGTRHETSIAACLAAHVDDRVERRRQTGAKDRGDIAALRAAHGGRVVVEAKDYGGKFNVGTWLTEAEVERGNDDAIAAVVIAKRRGTTDPLRQVVFMTVADLIALLAGVRPEVAA